MNKELQKRIVKRIFTIMWALLLFMFAVKLLFGFYYPIIVENERLWAISDFIDNHICLRYFLDYIFYLISTTIITLCCLEQKWFKSKKQMILYLGTFLLIYILKIINFNVFSSFGFIPLFVYSILMYKKKVFHIVCITIIDTVFMLLSLFVRDLSFAMENEKYIVTVIMQIDYYILLGILYIGVSHMGMKTVWWFFANQETFIKAEIERLEKLNDSKNAEEIEKLKAELKEVQEKIKLEKAKND